MQKAPLASITVLDPLPDFVDLCLNTPLYEKFHMDKKKDARTLRDTLWSDTRLDAYCIKCKRSATFQRSNPERDYRNDEVLFDDRLNEVRYRCTRNAEHELVFMFNVEDLVLTKVGQYPSFADLSAGELEKY